MESFEFGGYDLDDDDEGKDKKKDEDKKPQSRGPRATKVVIDEVIIMEALKKYWPEEFEAFMKKVHDEMSMFKKDVEGMIKIEGETMMDIWNEIYPVLSKMWKSGVLHGRIEKFNQMLIEKINRGDATFK